MQPNVWVIIDEYNLHSSCFSACWKSNCPDPFCLQHTYIIRNTYIIGNPVYKHSLREIPERKNSTIQDYAHCSPHILPLPCITCITPSQLIIWQQMYSPFMIVCIHAGLHGDSTWCVITTVPCTSWMFYSQLTDPPNPSSRGPDLQLLGVLSNPQRFLVETIQESLTEEIVT